jgi:hypothetical protein
MAKVSGMKIGVQAVKIALPGFVIPYMAVYDPNLMLQPVPGLEGSGYWLAVAYIVLKASLAMLLWGAAAVGYVNAPLAWWERLLAAVAAGFLVAAIHSPIRSASRSPPWRSASTFGVPARCPQRSRPDEPLPRRGRLGRAGRRIAIQPLLDSYD